MIALSIKRMNKKDIIALLSQLIDENQQLSESIAQLEEHLNHPKVTHLSEGTVEELMEKCNAVLLAGLEERKNDQSNRK